MLHNREYYTLTLELQKGLHIVLVQDIYIIKIAKFIATFTRIILGKGLDYILNILKISSGKFVDSDH